MLKISVQTKQASFNFQQTIIVLRKHVRHIKLEISTHISPPLTGAANLAICRLLGSGKRKQSLGHKEIHWGIYANLKSNNTLFQIFVPRL